MVIYRVSHDGAHIWIGYNGVSLTRREAETVSVTGRVDAVRHYVHLYGTDTTIGAVMCPLPGGRLLWRACAFLPAARATVRQVFGAAACVDVPLKYAPLCWGYVDGDGALFVPRLGDGARAWVHAASGGLRIRETAMSRWTAFIPTQLSQQYDPESVTR
jgi:hypothetical protein